MLKPDSPYYRLSRILGHYMRQVGIPPTDGRWHEIFMKLEQLDLLEKKIYELDAKCGIAFAKMFSKPNIPTDEDLLLAYIQEKDLESKQQIELGSSTESFYHLAWALRELLRSVSGLEKVDFEGIRQVRNRLLLHLDQPHNKNYGFAIGYGGALGPMIKPEAKHTYKDLGFRANVAEMKEEIFQISNKLDPDAKKNALN